MDASEAQCEDICDYEENEHEQSLTKAANKTLDLSRSLTDHCNKFADLDVEDFLVPKDRDTCENIKIETKNHSKPDFIETHNSEFKQARRKEVVREIVNTEKSYCEGLWLLLDHFIDSIQRSGLVSEDAFKTMFSSSLIEIYKSHCELLQSIEIRFINWSDDNCIGDLFADTFKSQDCPSFQQYQMYIKSFSHSLVKIHKISKSNSDFTNLLKVLEEDQRCNRLDITSFLLTPVQRIPRYVLLLKQLLRFTCPNHEDWNLITESLQLLASFLNRLNNSIEHSIKLVSMKRGIKRKKFGLSMSFKLNIQPPKRLKRQSSSNLKPPIMKNANKFDPITSTPLKEGNDTSRLDFDEYSLNMNISHLEDIQESFNETNSKSLYTYEEILLSNTAEGPSEGYKDIDVRCIPMPDDAPQTEVAKVDLVSHFSTLRKNVKSRKGPVLASHDIAIFDKLNEQPIPNVKPIKRAVSGSSPLVKDKWLKRFKSSQQPDLDEEDNKSVKSTKKSLKDSFMSAFKSFPSMPRSQSSIMSLSSTSFLFKKSGR